MRFPNKKQKKKKKPNTRRNYRHSALNAETLLNVRLLLTPNSHCRQKPTTVIRIEFLFDKNCSCRHNDYNRRTRWQKQRRRKGEGGGKKRKKKTRKTPLPKYTGNCASATSVEASLLHARVYIYLWRKGYVHTEGCTTSVTTRINGTVRWRGALFCARRSAEHFFQCSQHAKLRETK